jgi:site-specific DNA-cytosine methylase
LQIFRYLQGGHEESVPTPLQEQGKVDLMVGSFSCSSFSKYGNRMGFASAAGKILTCIQSLQYYALM